ncbi:MAG: hypothetical protein Q9M31_06040 [Mariprofundus sp.]|nr:hypothetical protein [Mariprofundus sp.]
MKSIWLTIIAGMTTGMGNGSVFTCAFLLAVGRGPFGEAGLWFMDPFNPMTYQGTADWIMFSFGIAFVLILGYALKQHAMIEGLAEE